MQLQTSSFFLCLILISSQFVYAAGYKEEAISVTPVVPGKLVTPDGMSRDEISKAVLILHGYQDHMDGAGNLQAQLAAAMGEAGIASVRFNFSGEGERNGYVVTSTYDSRVNEASAAFQYLKAKFPNATYGVQGWSLGGLTSMAIAGKNPDWFASMVLWSAAQGRGDSTDPVYNELVRQAIREGRAVHKSWADMTLTREHLVSFVGVNVSLGLPNYQGSFLTIRGDKDFLPSHDRHWLELVPTTDKSFVLIGGADHIFNVLGPGANQAERVIDETVRWFARTLHHPEVKPKDLNN